MKNRLLLSAVLPVCCFATMAAKPATAATVYCQAHASYGTYVAYLFRTGDARPTATSIPFIIDGGKYVSFTGVSTGHWFIRVAEADGNGNMVGQTHDGYLNWYFSTPLNVGDCWVNP